MDKLLITVRLSADFSSSHVWMWELDHKEGWVLKNWCFQTEVLEMILEGPLDSREILKEINSDYSLEGLMLKLKLQYFGHLMWRFDSLERPLMLGKIEGRRRGRQRMRLLNGISDSMHMSLNNLQERVKDKEACFAVHGVAKSQTWLSNWTTPTTFYQTNDLEVNASKTPEHLLWDTYNPERCGHKEVNPV